MFISILIAVFAFKPDAPIPPVPPAPPAPPKPPVEDTTLISLSDSIKKVIEHAKWQTTQQVAYNGAYVRLEYPNGDVPANTGVCTDVIIRAFRACKIDLQQLVHEDVINNRSRYSHIKRPNTDIDHRRCSNLIPFFKKHAKTLPIGNQDEDYKPGDIVFWELPLDHVGIVIDEKVPNTNRYYIVHNIGGGPQKEDVLFNFDIVGHFNYAPW